MFTAPISSKRCLPEPTIPISYTNVSTSSIPSTSSILSTPSGAQLTRLPEIKIPVTIASALRSEATNKSSSLQLIRLPTSDLPRAKSPASSPTVSDARLMLPPALPLSRNKHSPASKRTLRPSHPPPMNHYDDLDNKVHIFEGVYSGLRRSQLHPAVDTIPKLLQAWRVNNMTGGIWAWRESWSPYPRRQKDVNYSKTSGKWARESTKRKRKRLFRADGRRAISEKTPHRKKTPVQEKLDSQVVARQETDPKFMLITAQEAQNTYYRDVSIMLAFQRDRKEQQKYMARLYKISSGRGGLTSGLSSKFKKKEALLKLQVPWVMHRKGGHKMSVTWRDKVEMAFSSDNLLEQYEEAFKGWAEKTERQKSITNDRARQAKRLNHRDRLTMKWAEGGLLTSEERRALTYDIEMLLGPPSRPIPLRDKDYYDNEESIAYYFSVWRSAKAKIAQREAWRPYIKTLEVRNTRRMGRRVRRILKKAYCTVVYDFTTNPPRPRKLSELSPEELGKLSPLEVFFLLVLEGVQLDAARCKAEWFARASRYYQNGGDASHYVRFCAEQNWVWRPRMKSGELVDPKVLEARRIVESSKESERKRLVLNSCALESLKLSESCGKKRKRVHWEDLGEEELPRPKKQMLVELEKIEEEEEDQESKISAET